MLQTFHTKQDDLDELVGWMERLTQPYEFRDEKLRRHIDQFQIIPLPDGKYECIVMSRELPYDDSIA